MHSVGLLALLATASAADSTLQAIDVYAGSNCAGTPGVLAISHADECVADSCYSADFGNDTYFLSNTCNLSSTFDYAAQVFSEFNYVMVEYYQGGSDCGAANLTETDAFAASGSCQIASAAGTSSVIASLFSNGSLAISYYSDDACGGDAFYVFALDSANVSSGDCIDGGYKIYSSASANGISGSTSTSSASSGGSTSVSSASGGGVAVDTASGSSGISTGAIVGIVVAAVVVVLVVVGLLWCRRRRSEAAGSPSQAYADKHGDDDAYAGLVSPTTGHKSTVSGATGEDSNSLGLGPRSLAGLWDDEVIATARIPREKVLVQQLISRGGYGEVYYGLFNGQHVAVKMLLPESRKSVKHVNDFLAEVKMMATLDHVRIVSFVGVAWDSLTDLCVVSEYMEGGDLRALLASYEAQHRPLGFDRSKVTIALHVAHALTYLHSLDPPVLHRDLKSKNILLSSALEAKVTDFGISRERVDKTMTAGVGTSLWMAPEVMMGERYDDKADMFSFGVVLSELDLHALPYAHTKDSSNSGRKRPDTAILQMVAMGKIRVEFSASALESMAALGLSCVGLDPKDRPTAAEALYKLQTILRQDL
jgi:serine/threonine-protein kinase TNNI3K